MATKLLTLLILSNSLSEAFTIPLSKREPKRVQPSSPSYPFNQLVVFGDQYSDNGNGSYAHGLDPGNIYGFHTWTDGPIASSYLANMLGVPEVNYAWGGWFGGGLAGSTVDNDYTPAKDRYQGQPVPSSKQQIFDNYTANGAPAGIKKALQFVWIGQNDLKKHTNWYASNPKDITPTSKINQAFYTAYTSALVPQVEQLISLGAPAVLVANFPPLQTTPMCTYFFCKSNALCAKNWGTVIQAANAKLQAALAASQYADQIIYYDMFGFWTQMMQNKDSYGFTKPLSQFCDGNHTLPDNKWTQCTADKPGWEGARPYFYFTNDQPETNAHMFIAQDMQKTINKFFNISSSN